MRCESYIAGEWHSTSGAPVCTLGNPADQSAIVSHASSASTDDAIAAAAAAHAAFEQWSRLPLEQRRALIERLIELIEARKDIFAETITAETGKTRKEALAEVDAAMSEARAQLDITGSALSQDHAGNEVRYEPLGVVLLLTPFNFPLACMLRKLVPALLVGNTVVAKASELVPATSVLLFQSIDVCGLAPGVANLVLGDGRDTVPAMLDTGIIKAVSLTGSSSTGNAVAEAIGARNIRFQAELGGSNVVVVLADADTGAACDAVVRDAFACCGQWCTGTTRVVVEEPLLEEFTAQVLDRASQMVVGDGGNPETDMGPLISKRQRNAVMNAVEALRERGAELLAGGCVPSSSSLGEGFYFEPTVLLISSDKALRIDEEIFGPVLILIAALDAEDAFAKANDSDYGLSSSIFTRDPDLAEQFVDTSASGLCHVNLGTSMRDFALPLGGWGASGRGIAECGTFARDFFSRTKAVYRQQQ